MQYDVSTKTACSPHGQPATNPVFVEYYDTRRVRAAMNEAAYSKVCCPVLEPRVEIARAEVG